MLTFDYLQAYYIFQTEVRIATRSSCIRSHNQPILYINGNSSSAHRIRWWQNLDGFTMFMIDGFSHSHPNPLHPDPLPSRRVGFFCSKGGNYAKKYAPAIVVIERNRKRVQNFFLHTWPLWSWASKSWASRSRAREFGNIAYSFVFPSIFLLLTLKRCVLEWVRLGHCKSWSLFYIIPGLNQRHDHDNFHS